MNLMLMHSAFIAALAVLGHGPDVSGFSIATPPTTFGSWNNKAALAIDSGGDRKVALAIDGGGLRGILSASILKRVEKSIQYQTQDPHRRIGESFDIIAGTSTGGILATYFSAPLSELNNELNGTAAGAIDFYKKNAQKIFGKPPILDLVMRTLRNVKFLGYKLPVDALAELLDLAYRNVKGMPRHSGSGLDAALSETLPNLTFSELASWPHSAKGRNPSLLLVSYDVKYRRPVAFVADRYDNTTFFLRQEPLSAPFSPPFESTSDNFTQLFPGDENRRHSVVERWISRFNESGSCTEGFEYGPISFLGDVQILRDEVAEKWQKLQNETFNKIKKLNGEKPDADVMTENYVSFAQTNLKDVEVWRAARASSSAPTFLPAMKIDNFYRRDWDKLNANEYCDNTEQMEPGFFCDGGIVANNPGLQALLYLMARDQSMSADTKKRTKDKANAKYESSEKVDCDRRLLQDLPEDWEEYNKIALPNTLDNYALLSIGSGSTFENADVDSMGDSELWWIKQGAQSGNLISLLMDNLQMIAHTNLRTLFSLAGRDNAYLRIQYRTNRGIVSEHFDESLGKMDDPSDSTLNDYEDLGQYIAEMYAGTIDQFVFLHILKKEERDAFIKRHNVTAKEVFNGIPIADDELGAWKSKREHNAPSDVKPKPKKPTPILRAPPPPKIDVSKIVIPKIDTSKTDILTPTPIIRAPPAPPKIDVSNLDIPKIDISKTGIPKMNILDH